MTCLEVEENDAQSDEIVAISTTIEAMINRMDLVDSDLMRWKKEDSFIRESSKGSCGKAAIGDWGAQALSLEDAHE